MLRTLLLLKPRRNRLRDYGSKLMAEYVRAVVALGDGDFAADYAETVCPSLKRLRRRAKACAKILSRS